ncbi:MAG: hypothetical protein HXY46_11285 [Syntrophaceae bacterium]|nr:hypothetical protein [Syntrophaceae bacterium]
MRNLIAAVIGSITSFLMVAVIAFLVLTLDIKPFSDFATGKVNDGQFFLAAQRILFLYSLIVLPLTAFIAGVVAALAAKNKEYLIGLLCILPMFIVFFDFSATYLLMVFVASCLVIIGVRAAVYFKKR